MKIKELRHEDAKFGAPLTLEQLKKMDEKPVRMEDLPETRCGISGLYLNNTQMRVLFHAAEDILDLIRIT